MRQLFFILFPCVLLAQKPSDVLLTLNDSLITVDEFTRVYEKNLSLVQDKEQRDPKVYLDLFIEYKLKVQKAYALELDQKASYQKELSSYRQQLIKNYLTDVEVTEELVKEAYARTKEERRGQHILVRLKPGSSPEDTLKAYQKIDKARTRILAGEDFTKVAKEVSEDPSAKKNGGDLGYFKAFKMVYPFESAAYNTEIGDVSEPFRTRFGYHIVQPTDSRLSKGSRRVAHIIIASKQEDSTVNPKEQIEEVYSKLQAGASFETLAKNYSDDKNTAYKGGELNPIEEGQLSIPIFEEKAFALTEIGSYSTPFKSRYGWHIVTLLEKTPVPSYEVLKKSLENKILKDVRAQVISQSLTEKLRDLYGVQTQPIKDYFKKALASDYKKSSFTLDDKFLNEVAFNLGAGDKLITYQDVADHLVDMAKVAPYASKEAFVEDQVEKYTNKVVRSYHEDHLEEIDLDFEALLREYKEGLLLFDLLQTQVWDMAKTDSIGLVQFFNANKEQFKSGEAVETMIVTLANSDHSKKIKKALDTKRSLQELKEEVASLDPESIAVLKTVKLEDLPKAVEVSKGKVSTIKSDGSTILYKIINIIPSNNRTLDEVKGLVISAFQKEIEDRLVNDLKSEAEININKPVLKALETKYND